MVFETHIPSLPLRPYIKKYVVSEQDDAKEYRVLPSAGLVIGFQYNGSLAVRDGNGYVSLSGAGISGITGTFKTFKSLPSTGTVLVYFSETGFTHFANHPANELFNISTSLDFLFDKDKVEEVQEQLRVADNNVERIRIVDRFMLAMLKHRETDRHVVEAIKMIYSSKGDIRISTINQQLFISQRPFEKRFRKIVGTTPKKFASIIRFNTLLNDVVPGVSLTDIAHQYNFFDQAHFIKEFKQFTGETPDQYRRSN